MNDPNRDAVLARLKALGFDVQAIPEISTSPQPDLVARYDGVTMFVEVKTRSEDRILRGQMEVIRIGEEVEIQTDLGKHNSISAEVEHASRQLKAVAHGHDLRLLWY